MIYYLTLFEKQIFITLHIQNTSNKNSYLQGFFFFLGISELCRQKHQPFLQWLLQSKSSLKQHAGDAPFVPSGQRRWSSRAISFSVIFVLLTLKPMKNFDLCIEHFSTTRSFLTKHRCSSSRNLFFGHFKILWISLNKFRINNLLNHFTGNT